MELAAHERLKNLRHHFFSVAIDPILFKLAGNEDMHNIFDVRISARSNRRLRS